MNKTKEIEKQILELDKQIEKLTAERVKLSHQWMELWRAGEAGVSASQRDCRCGYSSYCCNGNETQYFS